MTEPFITLHLFLARHRLPLFISVAVLSVAAGLLSTRLEMDEDIMRMLPQRNEAIGRYLHAFRQLRQIDTLVIDVGIAKPNNPILFAAADKVFERLQAQPEMTNISYRLELHDFPGTLRLLHATLPNLLGTEDDYAELAQATEPQAIEDRLEWLKRSLAQPQGFVVKDVASVDPIGLSAPVLKRLKSAQAGFDDATIVEGRIVSSDGCHVLLRALPQFPSSDIERSGLLVDRLLQETAQIEKAFIDYGVHVSIIGGHRIGLDNSRLIRRDASRAITVAVVAMFLLAFVAYRRQWLALVTLVPPAVAVTVAGAVLCFVNTRISAIAVGCGTILLGITIDYAIHVLYHIDNHTHSDQRSIAVTVQGIVAPIVIGALTTLSAFLVMLISPVESHRQIGLFSAVGVAVAALTSLVLIPLMVPLDTQGSRPPLVMTRVFNRFLIWRTRNAMFVTALVVGITAVSLIGIPRLRTDGDISKLNGVTADTAADQAGLWKTWGAAASATTILVTGTNMQEALELNERIADSLAPLKREGFVTSYATIASICPSLKRQAMNQKQWAAFWTPTRKETLLNALPGIASRQGFRMAGIINSLDVLDAPPRELRPEDLQDTILQEVISQRTHPFEDTISISTGVKLASPEHYDRIAAALHAAVPQATLLNRVAFSREVAGLAKRGITQFAVVVAVVDMLILLLLLGNLGLVAVTLLPIAVGLLWTAGTMGLLGITINTVNFVFVVFIIGVGIDYSLFMVTSERALFRGEGDRLAATSGSITICALTTICGFGVLAVARHPALHSIGVTAFIGMLFSMLATVLLVPPCARKVLQLTDRRNAVPKAQTPSVDPPS
jgi:predicted exporter